MSAPRLTTAQVNKAGRILRRWGRDEHWGEGEFDDVLDIMEITAALRVVQEYRASHQTALTKANMGLRSVVRTEGCQIEVSQRLKRLATIVDKLVCEPTMQLSTMQDIGGCRAVLASIDEVRRVERRLKKNRLWGAETPIGS